MPPDPWFGAWAEPAYSAHSANAARGQNVLCATDRPLVGALLVKQHRNSAPNLAFWGEWCAGGNFREYCWATTPFFLFAVTRRSALLAPLSKLALGAGAVAAVIAFGPGSAHAACDPAAPANTSRVTVGGLQYDVTRICTSYDADPGKFETPANSGVMPWWGNATLASEFASAVADGLGSFTLLAYSARIEPDPFEPDFPGNPVVDNYLFIGGSAINAGTNQGEPFNYAKAAL